MYGNAVFLCSDSRRVFLEVYFFIPMFQRVKLRMSACSSSRFASGFPPPCPASFPMLIRVGAEPA